MLCGDKAPLYKKSRDLQQMFADVMRIDDANRDFKESLASEISRFSHRGPLVGETNDSISELPSDERRGFHTRSQLSSKAVPAEAPAV